jgi:hypothetical protein
MHAADPANPIVEIGLTPAADLSLLPAAMLEPEGTTRWDLTGFRPASEWTRRLAREGATVTWFETPRSSAASTALGVVVADPAGSDSALHWWFPQAFDAALRMGSRERLDFEERRGDIATRVRADVKVVGIGWVHLPSGPREVVLQRVLLDRTGPALASTELVHRWIDPRVGVVAEISGPATAQGSTRLDVSSAYVMSEVVTGAADIKLYVNQIDRNVFQDVLYGWDKGAGTLVSSLTPEHYNTIGQLIAANSWDFSGNNSGIESASTLVPVNSSETCNSTRCGYTAPGAKLERRDANFSNPDPAQVDKRNSVRQRQDRAGDVVLWLRAGAQHEGKTGSFGDGESRFCYVSEGGTTRTEVPLWLFPHQDAQGFYMQAGDTWSGGPFTCEQDLFNQTCGQAQLFDKIYAKACGTHTGKQTSENLKGGVITLPSGHTYNALLTRTVADFCVYSDPFCFLKVDEVRTVVYVWSVPYHGSVVRLQSVQNAADLTSFTTLDETDIQFGNFPPLTITATGTTESTVSLSWDPGRDTHRINGYKIYWDTDSGASSAYASNSVDNASQVSLSGTTATISGLSPGVAYYFTVVSLSDYRDPSSGVTTRYESLLYPSQISGDPSYVYPIEVQATTACKPTHEVAGVRVNRSGADIQICWSALTAETCLSGYRVMGADTPNSVSNFVPLADVSAATTCWTANPTQRYFIVVALGSAGEGPWGHYGR